MTLNHLVTSNQDSGAKSGGFFSHSFYMFLIIEVHDRDASALSSQRYNLIKQIITCYVAMEAKNACKVKNACNEKVRKKMN